MPAATSVDVLIPHYNDPAGLSLSLLSVAAQDSSARLRVVIYDDASDDAHFREVERIAAELTGLQIVLLRGAENRGRASARNELLDAIESPYVAWLDAGDEWYPDKLRLQLERLRELEESDPEIAYWVTCNYDWKWTGKRASPREQNTEQDQVRALLEGKTLRAYLWTLLGPAQAFKNVGRFDEQLPRLQDLDFFLRFVAQGGKLVRPADDRTLCVYHKSDQGRDAQQIRDCNRYIFQKHYRLYAIYGDKFIKKHLFNSDLLSLRIARHNYDWYQVVKFAISAARRKPITFAARFLRRFFRRKLQFFHRKNTKNIFQ